MDKPVAQVTCFTSIKLSFPKRPVNPQVRRGECPYCNLPLAVVKDETRHENHGWDDGDEDIEHGILLRCRVCDWWTLDYTKTLVREADSHCTVSGWAQADAVLKRFPINSASVPAEELRRYLANRFESRFDIHPRKLEEVMGSIFREHGFEVELTAYSKDGGIDLYLLNGLKNETIAVQAKRYKETRKIGIEEIDRFLGTLVRHDITHGIFVTTSSFTAGVQHSVLDLKHNGYTLELWDAPKILDCLKLSGRARQEDSSAIAWRLQQDLPTEMEKIGDYYGSAWPTTLPPEDMVEQWTTRFEKSVSAGQGEIG